jgi:hypothetical protein
MRDGLSVTGGDLGLAHAMAVGRVGQIAKTTTTEAPRSRGMRPA